MSASHTLSYTCIHTPHTNSTPTQERAELSKALEEERSNNRSERERLEAAAAAAAQREQQMRDTVRLSAAGALGRMCVHTYIRGS